FLTVHGERQTILALDGGGIPVVAPRRYEHLLVACFRRLPIQEVWDMPTHHPATERHGDMPENGRLQTCRLHGPYCGAEDVHMVVGHSNGERETITVGRVLIAPHPLRDGTGDGVVGDLVGDRE